MVFHKTILGTVPLPESTNISRSNHKLNHYEYKTVDFTATLKALNTGGRTSLKVEMATS
jgi:hypothetical protein